MRDTRIIASGLSAGRTCWAAGVLVAAALLLLVVGCGGGNGEQDGPGSSATYGIAEYAEHTCSREGVQTWVTTRDGRHTWGEAVELAEAHLEHQESYDGPLSVEFRRGFHEPWLKALGQAVDALRTQDADESYDEDRFQELTSAIQPAAFDDASAHLGERFEEACQKVIASWGGGPG